MHRKTMFVLGAAALLGGWCVLGAGCVPSGSAAPDAAPARDDAAGLVDAARAADAAVVDGGVEALDGGAVVDASGPLDARAPLDAAAPDASPPDAGAGPTTFHVYVGSEAGDIHHLLLDGASGALTARSRTAAGDNPSFLAFAPDRRHLYAVNEASPTGQVSAFAIDGATGELTFLNRVSSEGQGPAHLSVDPGGRFVLVSNYNDGAIATIAIAADGRLGATADTANPGRNAHQILTDASGRNVLVPCLGANLVAQFAFDPQSGALTPHATPSVASAPGAGPRHLDLHPGQRWAYVINELSSSITAHDYDAATGLLTPRDTVSTLPAGFGGSNTCAEIFVHPSGRFVYGSNRGHDSVARFAVDAQTGALTPLGHTPTGGRTPRSFGLTPDGALLLVANQRSDDVRVFRVDPISGELTAVGTPVSIPRPSFVGAVAW